VANTYNEEADPYRRRNNETDAPSRLPFPITPGGTNLTRYAKALRVYVASGPVDVVIVPIGATDDTNTVTLTFPTGLWYEPTGAKRVTAATGAVVHGYGD
jgi:hypothetical protein